jgi:acyl dehydratase
VSTAARPSPRFEAVHLGDTLPELAVELTPTLIVSAAVASRDFQDVHHDVSLARQHGMPDIFMNILATNGFVGRFITDWAGPEAQIRKISVRLGAPNFPGDTMRMTGTVTATELQGGEGVIDVDVRGRNGLGDHVVASVSVSLPAGG